MSPTGRRSQPHEGAPWLLEALGVLLLLLNMFLSAATTGRSARSGSALIGVMLAPACIGLAIVGVASLVGSMRNRRSRARVFLVAMVLVLLGNCGNLGSMARRGDLSAPPAATAPVPGQ